MRSIFVDGRCVGGGYAVLDAEGRCVVCEPLRVDPVDLRLSADRMGAHHGDLRAAHMGADREIEDAQAGWVGASAAALRAKFAEWQAVTERLCGGIADHEQAFLVAGAAYQRVDELLRVECN
ncbi:WXG100 family type VII secretion target [Mycobacterium sp. SM1]|uniref:WXG100 family type VII secretion target n=1 Tax=Mycobacterium sp. SM1 TaxID=2816243 RepID=UPI001BCC7A00|nr:WXG100 family type VII secretion target [Mycobacterium sp. SM1]MBS4728040.1 WXG100 family type VII secretion target [Mycobacterium sp. SM1]